MICHLKYKLKLTFEEGTKDNTDWMKNGETSTMNEGVIKWVIKNHSISAVNIEPLMYFMVFINQKSKSSWGKNFTIYLWIFLTFMLAIYLIFEWDVGTYQWLLQIFVGSMRNDFFSI